MAPDHYKQCCWKVWVKGAIFSKWVTTTLKKFLENERGARKLKTRECCPTFWKGEEVYLRKYKPIISLMSIPRKYLKRVIRISFVSTQEKLWFLDINKCWYRPCPANFSFDKVTGHLSGMKIYFKTFWNTMYILNQGWKNISLLSPWQKLLTSHNTFSH